MPKGIGALYSMRTIRVFETALDCAGFIKGIATLSTTPNPIPTLRVMSDGVGCITGLHDLYGNYKICKRPERNRFCNDPKYRESIKKNCSKETYSDLNFECLLKNKRLHPDPYTFQRIIERRDYNKIIEYDKILINRIIIRKLKDKNERDKS